MQPLLSNLFHPKVIKLQNLWDNCHGSEKKFQICAKMRSDNPPQDLPGGTWAPFNYVNYLVLIVLVSLVPHY